MADLKEYHRWQVRTGKHMANSGATFKAGQKFITKENLEIFNTDKDNPKYIDLGEVSEKEYLDWFAKQGATATNDGSTAVDTSTKQPEDSLEAMTVADLKALADDEEIDIHGLTRKDDILKAIRDARASVNSDDE